MAYRPEKFKYHSAYGGDEGLVLPFQEGGTQTFKEGDLVKLSSGKIIINTKASTDKILGFALADASGTTDTIISVQVIRPSDVFLMSFDADDTFVITNVGNNFETETANNKWEIDQDATEPENAALWVLASPEYNVFNELAATAGGAAYVRFNPMHLEFSRNSASDSIMFTFNFGPTTLTATTIWRQESPVACRIVAVSAATTGAHTGTPTYDVDATGVVLADELVPDNAGAVADISGAAQADLELAAGGLLVVTWVDGIGDESDLFVVNIVAVRTA